MLTKYSYTETVSASSLSKAISDDVNIVVALDHVDTLGSSIDIWFVAALDPTEEAALDSLVTFEALKKAKNSKHTDINNYRDYKLFIEKYVWPGDGAPYDVNSVSQFKMAATMVFINSGETLPIDFTWRDANNVDQSHDNTSFKNLVVDIWNRAWNIHLVAKNHKDAVDALTTVADVNSYNYTTNPSWPT